MKIISITLNRVTLRGAYILYYLSTLIAIISSTLYHTCQKSIPKTINPYFSLSVTYLIALAATILLYFIFPGQSSFKESFNEMNWAGYALGIAIVGIEIGVLLAYRANWNISYLAIIINLAVTLVLIPIGVYLFKEQLSAVNILGIAISIIGLYLINY